MKDIFTDLYKKLAGFFQASEEEDKKEASKNVACNRLKFVLMQDRTNLNPYLLERMRSEMIDVLSKYVEMDKEALELSFEQEGESMALMLSIPVIRAKEEEEIQAIIDTEEKAKALAKAEAEAAAESETEEETGEEEVEEDAETAAEESEASEDIDESNEELSDEVETDVDVDVDVEGDSGVAEACSCDCYSEEPAKEKNLSKKSKKNKD